MSHWISSKLKAAETILQQIDHQAAESLRKNDRSRGEDITIDTPTKTGGSVPLKDQLKKKTQESEDYHGKLRSDPSFRLSSAVPYKNNSASSEKGSVGTPKPSPNPKISLTDSDWTQLLSTPDPPTLYSSGNGVPGIRGLRKDGRRQSSAGFDFSEVKKNTKSVKDASKPARVLGTLQGTKLNKKASEESGFSDSAGIPSNIQLQIDGKYLGKQESNHMDSRPSPVVKLKDDGIQDHCEALDSKEVSFMGVSALGKADGVSDNDRLSSTILRKHDWNTASSSSLSDSLKRVSSSVSDGRSDSDSEPDSGSSSDSEIEREREERSRRKEQFLAEKAAARALEVLKEMENMVARLEGEKQSSEKILAEQAKLQAQEASMLQTTMIETMEAVELEKQKHNNTRMEVLARLAKLETVNADLARFLASVQWNLEEEVNKVAELGQKIELKKLNNEELQWKISNNHQTGTSLKKVAAPKGLELELELEREILEAEYSFMIDKIARLQEKGKKLGANIEMTRKEMEEPTDVEVELKRRLGQMTDHLIQKQAQVEALSAEKATLHFRIEAVSRLLDEKKSMTDVNSSVDLESGTWEVSDPKFGTMFKNKIRSSRKQLYSLIKQMDAIFLAGAVFLRRNSAAKIWSLVYLTCLHFWVIYILMSHSQPSYETKSGGVISLENINNTSGV